MVQAVVWDLGGTLIHHPPGGQDRDPLDTYEGIGLRSGVELALKAVAQAGCRQAVLSNTAVSDSNSVQRLLTRLGVAKFFSVIVATQSELDADRPGKPDRVVFQQVLEELNVMPEEAVMVGNSWDHDVVGALRAGLYAFWITNPDVSMGRPSKEQIAMPRVTPIFDIQEVGVALGRLGAC